MNEFNKRQLLIININRYLALRKEGRDDTYARSLLKEALILLDSDKNLIFKAATELVKSLTGKKEGENW